MPVSTLPPTSIPEPSEPTEAASSALAMNDVIPMPLSVTPAAGAFRLSAATAIVVAPGTAEMMAVGQYLADRLAPATSYALPVTLADGAPPPDSITLTTTGGDPALGDEGYLLTITSSGVTLAATRPEGLFRGVQTIRQLLPPAIESAAVQPGPWDIPAGVIRDAPRFVWRGMMLDVARHFFTVDDIKRLIDLMAYYKMNRLHLHLSDDQGWRIAIDAWPDLATIGGSTEVGGGAGGYYTQAQYADLVAYAQSRYVTIVPEIDMPGHTNAALASYPELNCDGVAPALYTGIEVGFSSLCVGKDITYRFVDDVIGELAALTPGPYIHIGGDEAAATSEADYTAFVEQVQAIVQAHGKQMVGWEEISHVDLLPTSIAQHWNNDPVSLTVQPGVKVIMSTASRAYMDMKYDPSTPLGLVWAGYLDVHTAYDWDPATQIDGLPESDILGVEAVLWSETLQTMDDVEYMAFPRLPGYAEIGWSPAAGRSWDTYRVRLAAHGPRFDAMHVHFFRSAEVPWK